MPDESPVLSDQAGCPYCGADCPVCDRLRAEVEALNLTLVSLWSYLRLKPGENHRCHGLACGLDACILCLAEGEIRTALQRSGAFDDSRGADV